MHDLELMNDIQQFLLLPDKDRDADTFLEKYHDNPQTLLEIKQLFKALQISFGKKNEITRSSLSQNKLLVQLINHDFLKNKDSVIAELRKRIPAAQQNEMKDLIDAVKGFTFAYKENDSKEALSKLSAMNVISEIYSADIKGATLLHLAAEFGDISLCQNQISHGVDVNIVNKSVETPLHRAVMRNNPEMCEFLLSKGANSNARENIGLSPLHIAANHNFHHLIEILIKGGANVELRDDSDITPLGIVAGNLEWSDAKNLETGIILLKHGANAIELNQDAKKTLLDYAAKKGELSVCLHLIKWTNPQHLSQDIKDKLLKLAIEQHDVDAYISLSMAGANSGPIADYEMELLVNAAMGNIKACIDLISRGLVRLDIKDKNGNTPLMLAAGNQHVKLASYFIQNGSSIHELDNLKAVTKFQPLHWAAMLGDIGTCRKLISNDVDVNILDELGRTPLHIASMYNHSEISEFLLSKGANSNAKDKPGHTPLHYALLNYSPHHLIEILIKGGANVEDKDKDKRTPLEIIAGHLKYSNSINMLEIGIILLKKGANAIHLEEFVKINLLDYAAKKGELTVCLHLINNKANPQQLSQDTKDKLLKLATEQHDVDAYVTLLKAGANREPIFDYGMEFLVHAALGNIEACMDLISRGLVRLDDSTVEELDKLDINNQLLLYAALGDANKLENIISKPPYGYGNFNVDILNTTLCWAVLNNHMDLCIYLLGHGADVNILDLHSKNKYLSFSATQNDYGRCAQLIQAGADIGVLDNQRQLFIHAVMGNTDKCLELIEHSDADLNATTPDGYSPLAMAATYGAGQTCLALIEKGAEFDKLWANQLHPILEEAARSKDFTLCFKLLEAGAELRAGLSNNLELLNEIANGENLDPKLYTLALERAAAFGNTALCNTLISKGADLTHDVLRSAISSGNLETVRALLTHENIRKSANSADVEFALLKNFQDIAKELLQIDALRKDHTQKIITTDITQQYQASLDLMSKMIILGQDSKEAANPSPQIENPIANWDGYSSNLGFGATKGAPLTINHQGVTYPIGYSIYIPPNVKKVDKVIVDVYGGDTKQDLDRSTAPTQAMSLFYNNDIPVIQLMLPDFLQYNHQYEMTPELHETIHACINQFYQTIQHNPAVLSEELKAKGFAEADYYLYGGSFGGRTAVRHGQKYPGSFKGYISHDGAMKELYDVPIMSANPSGRVYNHPQELFPIYHMKDSVDPVLMLQNVDDNNVNKESLIEAYKEAIKQGTADHIRLVYFEKGSPVYSLASKGHYLPDTKEDQTRYVDAVKIFMQQGPSIIPEYHAYANMMQDRSAKMFFRESAERERFLALASDRFYRKHKDDLAIYKTDKARWDQLWEKQYKPILQTLREVEHFVNEPDECKSYLSQLEHDGKLTDEVIQNAVKNHAAIYLELYRELNPTHTKAKIARAEDIYTNPEIIKAFREKLLNSPNEPSKHLRHFMLENLLFANPSLLPPLSDSKAWKHNDFEITANENKALFEAQVAASTAAAREVVVKVPKRTERAKAITRTLRQEQKGKTPDGKPVKVSDTFYRKLFMNVLKEPIYFEAKAYQQDISGLKNIVKELHRKMKPNDANILIRTATDHHVKDFGGLSKRFANEIQSQNPVDFTKMIKNCIHEITQIENSYIKDLTWPQSNPHAIKTIKEHSHFYQQCEERKTQLTKLSQRIETQHRQRLKHSPH